GTPPPTEGAPVAEARPAAEEKKPDEKAKPEEKKTGIAAILDRPMGRGLHVGVGVVGGYFYERFNSNAFNDPIGNYRLDAGTAGLALDFAYRSPFGLVLGGRVQGVGFGISDSLTGPLQIWEGLDATRRGIANGGAPAGGPPSPEAPEGVFNGELLPLPGTVMMANLWAGWRVYGASDMDLDLFLGYATEFVGFGKVDRPRGAKDDVEAFSDLWYHSMRPGVRLLYRPLGGKFGAIATEAAIGAGFVFPMVLKPRSTCSPNRLDRCLPFEQTYVEVVDQETGKSRMVRRGFARPPAFTGFDMRAGYLFEAMFVQFELGLHAWLRYSAVFYTAQEGMAKRNRFYDRASNIDLLVGPYLTLRGGI
ncbi:MAG: hypothetical protein AB2A00_29440, partial [Myxococcota bacterium]